MLRGEPCEDGKKVHFMSTLGWNGLEAAKSKTKELIELYERYGDIFRV